MVTTDINSVDSQIREFNRSVRLTMIGSALISLVEIGGGVVLNAPAVLATAIGLLTFAVLLALVSRVAQRGNLRAAALMNTIFIYAIALYVTVTVPFALSSTILVIASAPIVAVPYVRRVDLAWISAAGVVAAVAAVLLGRLVAIFPPVSEPLASLVLVTAVAVVTVVLFGFFGQLQNRFNATIEKISQTNNALERARAGLEQEIAERTASLQVAVAEIQARADQQARLISENDQQRQMLQELSVPVLPMSDDVLVMPLIGSLDEGRLRQAQERALRSVEQVGARVLILDVTGVPVVDTFVAASLLELAAAARLLGAKVLLVGVRPEVAQTIVSLGVSLDGVRTLATLQDGLRFALASGRA
jgi:rsbT co-antagonist protein RsbR